MNANEIKRLAHEEARDTIRKDIREALADLIDAIDSGDESAIELECDTLDAMIERCATNDYLDSVTMARATYGIPRATDNDQNDDDFAKMAIGDAR